MPSFKFKYENLLKLVETKENKAKNELALAYSELFLEEDKLNELRKKENSSLALLKDKTSSGCNVAVLKNINNYIKNLHLKIYQQKDMVNKKKMNVEIIQNKLLELSREKKVLEKLKEKNFEEYKAYMKLEEDRLIDQIVTFNSKLSR